MNERVNTGGLREFKINKPQEIEEELARKIDQGYERARARKRNARIRNIVIIIVLIILIVLGFVVFS